MDPLCHYRYSMHFTWPGAAALFRMATVSHTFLLCMDIWHTLGYLRQYQMLQCATEWIKAQISTNHLRNSCVSHISTRGWWRQLATQYILVNDTVSLHQLVNAFWGTLNKQPAHQSFIAESVRAVCKQLYASRNMQVHIKVVSNSFGMDGWKDYLMAVQQT